MSVLVIDAGIFFLVLALLLKISYEDYMTYEVNSTYIIVIWSLTTLFALGNSNLSSLSVLFYLVIIFGLPTFFSSFGLGDFLVITGLWSFFGNLDNMWLFIILMMMVWLVALFFIIMTKHHENLSLKTFLFKIKIPLIPVITFAFAFWAALHILGYLGLYI